MRESVRASIVTASEFCVSLVDYAIEGPDMSLREGGKKERFCCFSGWMAVMNA